MYFVELVYVNFTVWCLSSLRLCKCKLFYESTKWDLENDICQKCRTYITTSSI